MNNIEPKTEAWSLESLSVTYSGELWSIRCGGACQPEYHITAHTIEQAVTELVKQVTRDAIEDEAREWREMVTYAENDAQRLADAITDWKASQGLARSGDLLDDAISDHESRLNDQHQATASK